MAREPDLKTLYRGMAADETEMAVYRRNLKAKLSARHGSRRIWFYVFGLTALAAGLLLFWLPRTSGDLFDGSLEELQVLAASEDVDSLTSQARRQMESDTLPRQLNASAFLCLVLPYQDAVPVAASALQKDPRPKFRAFYLETLLDEADEYQINVDMVEKLMEGEEDELCVRLYSVLLELG